MKNCLIVGGSSGIGAAVTQLLPENDNSVIATYNSNSENSDTDKVKYHHLDALDSDFEMDYLLETIDALVYCPGSINLKPFARIKPDEFLGLYMDLCGCN